MNDTDNPLTRASDMAKMEPYLNEVKAILGGKETMRENASLFLPKFPDEPADAYAFRCKSARFTNLFWDIVENLAQRPLSVPVSLEENSDTEYQGLANNIDGEGNNLHVFATQVFGDAIANGIDWILVDYTADVPANATRAVEKKIGARPFWVRYPALSVLEARRAKINGSWEFVRFRVVEWVEEAGTFTTNHIMQVRDIQRFESEGGAYSKPIVTIWRLMEQGKGKEPEWVAYQTFAMSFDIIPLVPVLLGRREGNGFAFRPPMKAVVDLQIEHFEQESDLKYARKMTAYPMLSASGVTPPLDSEGNPMAIPVGPHRILWAPRDGVSTSAGSWDWIEPSGQSLTFLSAEVDKTEKKIRELGRQPFTADSGNMTTITSGNVATKGNSAIKNWALGLKDALEQAMVYTALWLKRTDPPGVFVNTEFDDVIEGDGSFSEVRTMRNDGDISRGAMIHEAKRRNILDRSYDPDADVEVMIAEMNAEDGEDTGTSTDGNPQELTGGNPADAGGAA